MTSVLISEYLIFLKLVFKPFWSRFQSEKHLFNIEKRQYFCLKITSFQLVYIYVLIDLVLWN